MLFAFVIQIGQPHSIKIAHAVFQLFIDLIYARHCWEIVECNIIDRFPLMSELYAESRFFQRLMICVLRLETE